MGSVTSLLSVVSVVDVVVDDEGFLIHLHSSQARSLSRTNPNWQTMSHSSSLSQKFAQLSEHDGQHSPDSITWWNFSQSSARHDEMCIEILPLEQTNASHGFSGFGISDPWPTVVLESPVNKMQSLRHMELQHLWNSFNVEFRRWRDSSSGEMLLKSDGQSVQKIWVQSNPTKEWKEKRKKISRIFKNNALCLLDVILPFSAKKGSVVYFISQMDKITATLRNNSQNFNISILLSKVHWFNFMGDVR
jgi:hypothetical protein